MTAEIENNVCFNLAYFYGKLQNLKKSKFFSEF